METCIFCKIIAGTIDSAKIWENDTHVAILDINPNTPGMTIVITKQHHNSDVFKMKTNEYLPFLSAAQEVAHLLEKKLGVKRVAMVSEGMGINHAHIKLYPLHGLENHFQEMWGAERIYFDKYEGYLTTQLGPQVDMASLKQFAKKFYE